MPVARRLVVLALPALLPAAPARAQQRGRPDPNPDGSIEIEQVRVGVLAVGTSIGGGRLRFRGEEHRFSVRGIEFGSVGVSSLSARGEELRLRTERAGGQWRFNEAGVTIELR